MGLLDSWDDDRSDTEAAAVAALAALHRKKVREGTPNAPYATILEHFQNRGKRLAGERVITEELLTSTFEARRVLGSGSIQQELVITGRIGNRAAGRFLLNNSTALGVTPEWAVGDASDGQPVPPLAFQPEQAALAPNTSCLVRVAANLQTWLSARTITVPVECRAGHRRDRLWLVIVGVKP